METLRRLFGSKLKYKFYKMRLNVVEILFCKLAA